MITMMSDHVPPTYWDLLQGRRTDSSSRHTHIAAVELPWIATDQVSRLKEDAPRYSRSITTMASRVVREHALPTNSRPTRPTQLSSGYAKLPPDSRKRTASVRYFRTAAGFLPDATAPFLYDIFVSVPAKLTLPPYARQQRLYLEIKISCGDQILCHCGQRITS